MFFATRPHLPRRGIGERLMSQAWIPRIVDDAERRLSVPPNGKSNGNHRNNHNGYHPKNIVDIEPALQPPPTIRQTPSISSSPTTLIERQQQWIQHLKPLQRRYLQPFAALVGLALDNEQPIVYTPYHPKSGHALFIFHTLAQARRYLDSFLFSLKLSTPALDKDWHLHLFLPPTSDNDLGYSDGAAAFFDDAFAKHMVAPDQAVAVWRQWAKAIEEGEVQGSWRTLHMLVVDDLGYWARQAAANPVLERAITTVLTKGLARRVVVIATVTYDDWFRLPRAWRQAFAVGFYGGLSGTHWGNNPRFHKALRTLGPDYGLIVKDDGVVPFRSVLFDTPVQAAAAPGR